MQVVLNGEAKEVADGTTVSSLLTLLGFEQRKVAVELNQRVIPRSQHTETLLAAGDRVEIVTFVGGG